MRLPKFFRGIAFVAAAASLSLALCFAILAWSEPGQTPPGGNVAAPINTGGITQTKSGDLKIGTGLTITSTASAGGTAFALAANVAGNTGNKLTVGQDGNVIVGAQLTAPKICFGGSCATQWTTGDCLGTGNHMTGINEITGEIKCSGVPLACKTNGNNCAVGADCCSTTCGAGKCCESMGNNCASAADCCSGTCTGGKCVPVPSCKTDGNTCAAGADCCSTTCGAAGKCCEAVGKDCATAADCCAGICSGHKCVPVPSCKPEGNTCASTADCCTGSCTHGKCACKATGSACANPTDCCTGVCTRGKCACKATGSACAKPADCCTGVCTGGKCVAAPKSCGGCSVGCSASGYEQDSCGNSVYCGVCVPDSCTSTSCSCGTCQAWGTDKCGDVCYCGNDNYSSCDTVSNHGE